MSGDIHDEFTPRYDSAEAASRIMRMRCIEAAARCVEGNCTAGKDTGSVMMLAERFFEFVNKETQR